MASEWRSFFRNPFGVSSLTILLGMLGVLGATFWTASPTQNSVDSIAGEVGKSIAIGLITAGAFGFIFEYFSKRTLIHEAIRRAVGQSKAVSSGVEDVATSAYLINYDEDLENSSTLIISARFSTSFLDRHKDKILDRIKNKKSIQFVRMTNTPLVQELPGYRPGQSAEEFFRKIVPNSDKGKKYVTIYECARILSYNFVQVDRGIWIKLYWNEEKPNTPPAFFVTKNSELYQGFSDDIKKLTESARRVTL